MALFMRLKGTQGRNLYDLVTVSREYGSVCVSMITGETGKIEPYVERQVRKPACYLVREHRIPDHE